MYYKGRARAEGWCFRASKALFAFSLLLSLGRMLQPWKRRGLSRRRRACRLGDVRRRGHPAPRSRLRRAFFYVVFLQAFRARKPRRDLEQNLVAKKRDRGIPRSRNLLEPTACRGNTAATRKKGGTVIDGLRVPARADQEIPRSRNPQLKKFQIEKSRMQRRRRGEQKGERGAVSARSASGHPQLERSCGFGRRRHEGDRCGFEARTPPRRQRGRWRGGHAADTTGHARRLHSTGATQDTGEQA